MHAVPDHTEVISDQGERPAREPAVRWVSLALWGLAACALLVLIARAVLPSGGELTHGYAAYYTSAWLVAEGEDASRFYENDWFSARIPDAGIPGIYDIYFVNPPTMSLLFLPLVLLSPQQADWVWIVVSLLLLGVALAIIYRTIRDIDPSGVSPLLLPALLGVTFTFNPLYTNLEMGQVYALLLVVVALAFRGAVLHDDRLFGLSLGLLMLCKGAMALLWLVPVLDRRWRTLGYGITTIIAGIVITAPVLGLRPWWVYLTRIPDLIGQPWTGVTAYQTLTSFIHHLLRADPVYSPNPLVNLPWLPGLLTMLVTLLLVAAALYVGWGQRRTHLSPAWQRALRFALIAAIAIPLQPVGEEHHSLLLLVPVAVVLALLAGSAVSPARVHACMLPGVLGILLLAFPLPFADNRLRDGWLALFAYPKLYGALLLAVALALAVVDRVEWRAMLRQRQP